jgi:parallel beta-helix repeat protein
MQTTPNKSLLIILILLNSISTTPLTLAQGINTTTPQPENIINNSQPNLSLQEIINNAKPGTLLSLPSGTYYETLIINKPLHLTGHNTNLHPTSQTNGYAIWITAENVTLNNLHITNHASGLYTTAIKISAPYTIITHCILQDTPIGIAIWSNHNTIDSCDFQHCNDEGIVLLGTSETPCSNTTITDSRFSENCDGIELQHASFTHITSCTFTNNTHAGIDAIESHNNNNLITNCTFTNNDAYGIYLAHSTENLISHCTFIHDTLTLIHATHTILQNSQIPYIHLVNNSSLILDQCINTTTDTIIADHSTYEIQTVTQETNSNLQQNESSLYRYQLILSYLFSHIKALKIYLERITQERM